MNDDPDDYEREKKLISSLSYGVAGLFILAMLMLMLGY